MKLFFLQFPGLISQYWVPYYVYIALIGPLNLTNSEKERKNIAWWAKKSFVKGQSIQQELEESLRRGLCLLVKVCTIERERAYYQYQSNVNHHELATLLESTMGQMEK